MKGSRVLALCILALVPGCATIFTGPNQSVSIETRNDGGAAVAGGACKLQNDRGTWFVTTPGLVNLMRSYGDLAITCTHYEHEAASVVVKSVTGAMMLGNILMIGGIIGAAIDAETGAAFDYPALITVDFGPRGFAILRQ